jgi:hypothetical protein
MSGFLDHLTQPRPLSELRANPRLSSEVGCLHGALHADGGPGRPRRTSVSTVCLYALGL